MVAASAPVGFMERLPKWLICVPLVWQWLWLALRYRSATLPSSANPGITAGGLVGEGKTEYFRAMGARGLAASARLASFVVAGVREADALAARACIEDAQLEFPLIAKPDIGWCGFGVRRIDSAAELQSYLHAFPAGECVILQEYVAHEGEAGIFYVRAPGAAQGEVTALALRQFPQVAGDGSRTLAELIAADPRVRRLMRDRLHDCALPLAEIPAAGRAVRLATIGSTRVGGLYLDGARLVTPALSAAIDAIAREMEFCFGRFDLRFESEAALMAGAGFKIIEVNGAGSETIDAWDPATPALAAFRKVFAKQRRLFAIADAQRRRGHRPVGVARLARLYFRQQRLIERYPHSN